MASNTVASKMEKLGKTRLNLVGVQAQRPGEDLAEALGPCDRQPVHGGAAADILVHGRALKKKRFLSTKRVISHRDRIVPINCGQRPENQRASVRLENERYTLLRTFNR